MSTAELATSYAALILADDGVEITVREPPQGLVRKCAGAEISIHLREANCQSQSDKIQTLIKAANVADVEPIWASLFAKVRNTETAHEFTIRPRESRRTG